MDASWKMKSAIICTQLSIWETGWVEAEMSYLIFFVHQIFRLYRFSSFSENNNVEVAVIKASNKKPIMELKISHVPHSLLCLLIDCPSVFILFLYFPHLIDIY